MGDGEAGQQVGTMGAGHEGYHVGWPALFSKRMCVSTCLRANVCEHMLGTCVAYMHAQRGHIHCSTNKSPFCTSKHNLHNTSNAFCTPSLVFALQSTLFCYSVALPLIGSPEAAFCVSCMAIQQWHAYCKCPSFSSVSAFPWASTSHRGLLGC